MKVIAFNSSPKMGRGNTARILDPFLEGMRENGAEIELFYTKKMKIERCESDLHCWLKVPGECIYKDDMRELYPKLLEADFVVFATPVYYDGMTGPMKMLIDRLMPIFKPFFEIRDGHSRHVVHPEHKPGSKVVLVSTCGLWEMDNFDPLLIQMEAVCRNWAKEFAGALLRPHAEITRVVAEGFGNEILEAARDAGRQLSSEGEMSPETLKEISRELLSHEDYVALANQYIQGELDKRQNTTQRASKGA
jgi:multimeric flavodoxin WrbA